MESEIPMTAADVIEVYKAKSYSVIDRNTPIPLTSWVLDFKNLLTTFKGRATKRIPINVNKTVCTSFKD